MLTLTRKAGESIVIGDSVRITVKDIRGRNVQLTIDAPRGISIYRDEIYRAIEAENRAAAAQPAELPATMSGASISLAAPLARGEDES